MPIVLLPSSCTVYLPLTSAFEGFFSVCLNLSFRGRHAINCFHGFLSEGEGSLIAE